MLSAKKATLTLAVFLTHGGLSNESCGLSTDQLGRRKRDIVMWYGMLGKNQIRNAKNNAYCSRFLEDYRGEKMNSKY